MATVDSLPGDQRAVLQLVLGRGRSYDDIARLLSIDPTAVRGRALAALEALGPQTGLDPEARAQISDYLLGQLPDDEVDTARERLATSPGERAWARVLSSELAPLASGPLPEIPTESSGAAAAAIASPEPEPTVELDPAPAVPATPVAPEAPIEREERAPAGAGAPRAARPAQTQSGTPRSSRLGGLIMIAGAVVVVIVVLVIVLTSGGSSHKHGALGTTTAASAHSSTTTSSSGTATTAAKVIAQINLTPTATGSKSAGIAEVLREGTTNGIALVAQNMAPNATKPPNAYAVWLYNSPTDATILGFVNPGVGSNGKLSTAGPLPSNAAHYKQLVVTLETTGSPKKPGPIVLQGTLTGV